jgi:putative membrane protein
MWLSAMVSAVHLLCLALGLCCLVLRERALAATLDDAGVRRVLTIDNVSGVVALVWMGSGLWRAFGGLEKGSAFYLHSAMFWAKMGGLTLAWALETPSMVTFIRWRTRLAQGEAPDTSGVARLRRLHGYELACMVATVFLASLMARGVGAASTQGASAEVARGRAVYEAHCAACHQADGRGLNARLAADFVGDPSRLAKGDEALLRAIERGVPGTAMVGFAGRLSEAERRAALAYLRSAFGRRR